MIHATVCGTWHGVGPAKKHAGHALFRVAEEAVAVCVSCGIQVSRFYDVGVAGIHRLLAVIPEIRDCDAVICVAGMEGALPSVLAGLLDAPLVA
eukprot:scaffold832_cov143-Pinguiococcus_pyrenoidosus.AAC.2